MKQTLLLMILMSCTASKNENTETIEVNESSNKETLVEESGDNSIKNCEPAFSQNNTKFKMTGYKYEDKTPVSGTFKEWTLDAPSQFKDVKELLSKAEFNFVEKSLDFGKVARNKNINGALMSNIMGDSIKGKIIKVNENSVDVSLDWGGMNHVIPMNYTYEKGLLKLSGSIDILKMGFKKAFNALAKLCYTHHMRDGVSKTWNVVDIEVESRLVEEGCL